MADPENNFSFKTFFLPQLFLPEGLSKPVRFPPKTEVPGAKPEAAEPEEPEPEPEDRRG